MKKGFSLIELLVVIAITAIITAVALPNFLSARERAKDSRKKDELNEIKNSLRLYYNDWQDYPPAGSCPGGFNYVQGCGADHESCCPCAAGAEFAVGSSCDVIYMKKFPTDFGSSIYYYKNVIEDDFCLKTALDNAADPDITISQSRCGASCTASGGSCTGTDYCVCAD